MNTYEHGIFGRIRVIDENGELWYCSKDITRALGYRSSHVTAYYTVDEERRLLEMATNNGTVRAAFINAQGLERICTGTKRPNGVELLDWLKSVTAQKKPPQPELSEDDTPLERLCTICELYVKGNNRTKDVILSALSNAQHPAFLTACRLYELVSDGDFFNAVRDALNDVDE